MKIYVCVGSSCHLKGSYSIMEKMKVALKEKKLIDKVTLSAAFCLGQCANGVTIKVNDEVICGLNESNFETIFQDKIIKVAASEGLLEKEF